MAPDFRVAFFPAMAPHPNASAARAFADTADFSKGHLPYRWTGWSRRDVRGGRTLLISPAPEGLVPPELALCHHYPFTLEYMLLPPIPDDLLASVLVHTVENYIRYSDAFFDPSEGYQEEQFTVMCWARTNMGWIFLYSSVSGTWTHGASIGSDALGLELKLQSMRPAYAYGCLYWKVFQSKKLIKLRIDSMEFSTVSLPSDYENRYVVVIEGGEGRIELFSVIYSLGSVNHQPVHYSIWQNESENAIVHPVATTVPLPHEFNHYKFEGAAGGYVFLMGLQRERPQSAFFSLEIKTMKLERVCSSKYVPHRLIPYFGFSPFMSLTRM